MPEQNSRPPQSPAGQRAPGARPAKGDPRKIRIGHSPDADDAFMFFGIATGRVVDPGFEVQEIIEDIEGLNRRALRGDLEVTAISFHAYAHVADRYRLLTCGGSLGKGYGPIVVSRRGLPERSSRSVRVAVPGELTTASLLLQLHSPAWTAVPTGFDEVMARVQSGEVEAGVVIHEGQLSFPEWGLEKVVDLGAWWTEETGLPVPLGGNAVRKDIQDATARRLEDLLRKSIRMAWSRREEALDFALPFARGLDRDRTSRFIDMYVNDLTLDCGEEGERAVRELLRRGYRAGILPREIHPEFLPRS